MEQLALRLYKRIVRKCVRDDDVVDRLHHNTSVIILCALAAATVLQEYVGSPINCWTPATFQQEHYMHHINDYCWAHPLRYPHTEDKDNPGHKGSLVVDGALYQWVTLIFVFQAILLKLPNKVWTRLNGHSGTSVAKVTELLGEGRVSDSVRSAKVEEAASYMETWLQSFSRLPQQQGHPNRRVRCVVQCCKLKRRSGSYLCVVYLSIKALYLLVVVANVLLLSLVLDGHYWYYGIAAVSNIISSDGDSWRDVVNFPRLMLCDFRLTSDKSSTSSDDGWTNGSGIRDPVAVPASANDVFVVQCVLSINSLLQKAFVFLWFWFAFIAILNVATFVTWSANTVCACAPYLFSRKFMKVKMPRVMSVVDNHDNTNNQAHPHSFSRDSTSEKHETASLANSNRAHPSSPESHELADSTSGRNERTGDFEEECLEHGNDIMTMESAKRSRLHHFACTDASFVVREGEQRERFLRDYLRSDGMLVLWIVAANTDKVMVKELVQCLWDRYHHNDDLAARCCSVTSHVTCHAEDDVNMTSDLEHDVEVQSKARSNSGSLRRTGQAQDSSVLV